MYEKVHLQYFQNEFSREKSTLRHLCGFSSHCVRSKYLFFFFWHPTTDYLQTFLRNSKSSPNDAMPACALLNVHITHWGKIHFCQNSKICIKHHQNVWENILSSQNEVGLKNFEICNWQNFQLFRSACFLRENSNNLVILQVSSKSNIFDKNSTFVPSVARTPQDPQYKNWDLGSNFYH